MHTWDLCAWFHSWFSKRWSISSHIYQDARRNWGPKSQKNMDYSIFKALNFNIGRIEAALICYNVMCQWSIHMKDRVTSSSHLKIPDSLELRLGIGLFHIYGHQDTCLARYSPSFIEGGWQIDGETIEILWALLNEISRSTRGMSTSHCREVIDDHINDLNWKKLIDLGRLSLIGTASELTDIIQSMLYLSTTIGCSLGQHSVQQHLII